MEIISVVVGPIQTNCYLLCDRDSQLCAIIDPGDEPEKILSAIRKSGCTPRAIYLTHGHFDHHCAVPGLLSAYPDLPVYIHEQDTDPQDTQAGWGAMFPRLPQTNQRYYAQGDRITLGQITLTVLETPGHTRGSVCLIAQDVIFCGDTLFYTSCGRTDLAGGSYPQMMNSLAKLSRLEGDYRCLPGHDRETTLSFERNHNPHMKEALSR